MNENKNKKTVQRKGRKGKMIDRKRVDKKMVDKKMEKIEK